MYSKDGTATVEYDCSTLLKAGRFRDPRLYPSFFTDGKVLPTPAGLFLFFSVRVLDVGFIGYVGVSRFLARVLNVGRFGYVSVSRDRIEISEVMRAMETTFSYIIVFLNFVGARIARPRLLR